MLMYFCFVLYCFYILGNVRDFQSYNTNCFISKIIRMLLLTKKFARILKNPREYALFTPRDISRNISGGEMRNGCISRLY